MASAEFQSDAGQLPSRGRLRKVSTIHEIVRADEIAWTSAPLSRLEDRPEDDFLALSHDEVLDYAADCREHLRALRETLAQSLAFVVKQRERLARAAQTIKAQRREIQDFRETSRRHS